MPMPATNGRPGRSRSSTQVQTAVRNTWVCSTTLASDAVIPTLSAVNKKPNWPTPCSRPNSTTQRQCTRGGLMNSTSGKAAQR